MADLLRNPGRFASEQVANLRRNGWPIWFGIRSGVRGRENEARKVALYLIKRCCDRTLPEIAEYFGIGNYSTVSWSCRTVAAQMSREKNFRDRVERIITSIG